MNILIVDDEPTSRLILEATLKRLGHQTGTARDGQQALEAFKLGRFQVVISDQLMPGMDGLELCRRVRGAQRPQYTYFMLLTSIGGKSSYLDGMRAGADDFITKPFDEEILAARLAVAQRILNLQSEVRQLAGLLPICSLCKKVRDDQNYWHQVESYISLHTEATFTHSYCPDCFQRLKEEIEALKPAHIAECEAHDTK
jgi:DNA-binding response OmpR family regulator